MMRIHSISSKTNGILGGLKRFAVPLGHDIIADHPSGFPDVELLRPSVGSAKFVPRGAPLTDLIAYFFRNSWMVGKGPHQAFLVVTVRFHYCFALFIGGLWISIILADKIGGESVLVVGVGLSVWHGRVGPWQIRHPIAVHGVQIFRSFII